MLSPCALERPAFSSLRPPAPMQHCPVLLLGLDAHGAVVSGSRNAAGLGFAALEPGLRGRETAYGRKQCLYGPGAWCAVSSMQRAEQAEQARSGWCSGAVIWGSGRCDRQRARGDTETHAGTPRRHFRSGRPTVRRSPQRLCLQSERLLHACIHARIASHRGAVFSGHFLRAARPPAASCAQYSPPSRRRPSVRRLCIS